VVDRHGKLLRAYAMADGRWRLPVDAKANVDPTYLKLLFAYEDKRFYSHHGIDPLALSRAALQLGSRGRIVSGGSTITMQLARLMEPRRERSVYAKLRQMVSGARALWRQSRGHSCGLDRLFRQGAEAAVAGGGSPSGGVAAIAGTPPPRSPS
jgi:membrane carboxypeptidase/penicillin-binding protein PbpC